MGGLLIRAQIIRDRMLKAQSAQRLSAQYHAGAGSSLLPPLDPDAHLEPLEPEDAEPLLDLGAIEPVEAAPADIIEIDEYAPDAVEEIEIIEDGQAPDNEATGLGAATASSLSEAGVGDSEQAEIMRQIDLVVEQNKIKVTPETFVLKAEHRGVALPIMVNFAALVLMVLGVGAMYWFFNAAQQDRGGNVVQLASTEGELIKEIKKQNAADLAAKQKEIEDIQGQLGSIAKQRDTLQSTMDSRVAAKTAELKQAMQSELDAERKRLRAQGYTEEEINRRLAEFERKKNEEYTALLASFRAEAESQKQKSEADLRAREAEYSQALGKVNQEKEAIANESRKREAELRRQLEAKAAQEAQAARSEALASAQANQAAAQAANQAAAQAQTQLTEAAAQIKQLAQARDAEHQINVNITGYYGTVRDLLRDNKLEQADKTLELLRNYLDSAPVQALANYQTRRDTDIYVVESLSYLIEREQAAVGAALTAAQQTAVASGQGGSGGSASSADLLRVQEEGAKALAELQKRSDEEIARLKAESVGLQKKIDELGTQGSSAGEQLASRDKTIASLNTQKDKLTAQVASLQGELTALKSSAEKSNKSLAALEKTVANQKAELQQQKDLLAAADQQGGLAERIQSLESQLAELRNQTKSSGEQLASSTRELERLRQSLASVQAERDSAQAEIKKRDDQIAKTARDSAGVAGVAANYTAMLNAWSSFVQADRELRQRLAANPPADPVAARAAQNRETKQNLDKFLASETMKKAFPDLLDRIKVFDKAFETAGAENLTLKVADQVYAIASFETKQQRLDYVKKQIKADPALKDFYENLYELINTQAAE